MLTSKRIISEPPEELQEDPCKPIKKLRGLVPGAGFTEQAKSLLPHCTTAEDQVQTAYQIAREWDPPIPDCVSKFYAS